MYSEQILLRNLAALEQAQGTRPAFAALDPQTTRALPHGNGLRLEIRADAGWVPLWNADPVRAAARQLQAAGEATQIFVIGGGVGHLLDALDAARRTATVVILEPDPGVAVLLLARRDWSGWFSSGRLRLLTGPEYTGAASLTRSIDGAAPSAVIVNEALAAHRPQAVARARKALDRMQAGAAANAEARRQFAGRYLLQTLANLPVIAREGDAAALDGAFSGRPAVMVAAGPSLDRTVRVLAAHQDRVVILAADTALRPLLAAGVRPHLVVGLDPSDVNSRHLSGLADASGIWLAGEGSLHPRAFDGFAGRIFHFKVSDHEPWPWLGGAGLRRGTLRAWGSVATSAFDLALRMGCNPIVFTGHDLAFTGDRPYCDNTVFHEEWRAYLAHNTGDIRHYEELMMQGRPLLRTEDVNGAAVQTTSHLIAFRDWIVEQTTLTTDRRFVNGTGAGILAGPRIEQLPLDEVLRALTPELPSVRDVLADRHERSRPSGPVQFSTVSDDVIARWVSFTADTVTPAEIRAAIDCIAA